MKVIDKEQRLYDYCSAVESCEACVLNNRQWKTDYINQAGKCLNIGYADEEELDEALRLIDSKESHDTTIEELFLESVDLSNDGEIDLSIVEEIIASEDIEDPINPSWYTNGKIEVIEFIEDKSLGYCLGNAVKYIARAGKKDPTKEVEDLEKAKWYVERRIKEVQGVV